VARAVFDVGDEPLKLPYGLACLLGHNLDKAMKKPYVLPLVLAADVVGLPNSSARHDGPYRSIVVDHVEPVPNVLAIAIDRQGLALQHIEDHEGDELFRKLKGPVVVGTIRDGDRKAVGVAVGLD